MVSTFSLQYGSLSRDLTIRASAALLTVRVAPQGHMQSEVGCFQGSPAGVCAVFGRIHVRLHHAAQPVMSQVLMRIRLLASNTRAR